jgi:hypothetical protein
MLLYITATVVIGIAVSIAGIRDEICSRPVISLLPLGNFYGPHIGLHHPSKAGMCNIDQLREQYWTDTRIRSAL